jgi:tape measure domain-containing protein
MSQTIDTKVVEMQFKNSDFDKNVQSSVDSINGLKKQLNFSGSIGNISELTRSLKNLNFDTLTNSVQSVANSFSVMGIAGITVIANLVNSALNAGKQIYSALFIDPIKSGKNEYETQMNSIQTILANTQKEGTNLKTVNAALDELNAYSDKTIYNFTEMARNIGTFTAAGVKLDDSVSAIKGIANLAAVSGSNSQQASTAMYQLSQALATGTVRLMDWNSVVNAGMGGQVFQDALTETARAHGVAVDTIIQQEGSFRDSLSKGWLTADILNETLSKFTGDLSAEQLKTMGYTDEQIVGILKLGKTASEAATKVKTFTQLFDTLKEAAQSGWAQTWRIIIGDFEEARTFMTELNDLFGGIIGSMSETRNALLQSWSTMGGRAAMLDTIRAAIVNIGELIKPIRDAFREIFPPVTAVQLLRMTLAIRDFVKGLKMAPETVDKVKRIFKGLFAVLDIGRMAFVAIGKGLSGIFKSLAPAGSGLLDLVAKFADYIVNIRNVIKYTDKFGTYVSKIGAVINNVVIFIKELFSSWKDGFKGLDSSPITKFLDKLKERFAPLSKIMDMVSALTKGILSFVRLVAPIFIKLGSIIGDGISAFASRIADGLSNFQPDEFFDMLNSGLFAGLLLAIKKFIDKGSGMFDGISDILKGVKDSLVAWQTNLKADTLLKIAGALGIMALALIGISLIDSERLSASLGAMTAMFVELIGALAVLDKTTKFSITGSGGAAVALISMASAILILSGAMLNLGRMDPVELLQGVAAVIALTGILILSAQQISKSSGSIMLASVGLIAFSLALGVLSGVVKKLAEIDTNTLLTGLLNVGALLAGLVGFMKLANFGQSGIVMSIGIGLLAGSLLLLSVVVERMAGISWEGIGKGLTVMAGALLIIAGAMYLIPPTIMLTSLGLIAVAGALVILAKAMEMMGSMSWDEVGRGMVVLAGSLAILILGLTAMSSTLAGSAALLVAAVALAVLAPPLKQLGQMKLEEIGIALLAIAGALTVFGLAGLVLTPVIPSLLGVAAAVALFGVGALAAGAGILALSAGMAALAVSGAAGAAALVVVITSLVSLLPMVAEQVGKALISLIKTIALGAPAIIDALVVILSGLIDGLVILIPKIVDAVMLLIEKIYVSLSERAPLIVEAGWKILMALLEGFKANIGEVAAIGISIVTNLMDAISLKLPDLIAAGWNFILSFINGLSESTVEYMPQLMVSLQNLGLSIVEGLVLGMDAGSKNLKTAAIRIATEFLNGLKDFLGIHSPADAMIPLGTDTIQGFINGVVNAASQFPSVIAGIISRMMISIYSGAYQFVQAGIKFATNMKEGLLSRLSELLNAAVRLATTVTTEISNRYNAMKTAGQNFVQGFINGIGSYLQNAIAAAANLAQSVLNTVYNILGIKSPSTEMYDAGMYLDRGLANGIRAYGNIVETEVGNLSNSVLDGFNEAISQATQYMNDDMSLNPVITPVLDLDELKKGGKQINKMLGKSNALDITPTTKALSTVAKSMAQTGSSVVAGEQAQATAQAPVIQYVQNNYSPKALSSVDVYRETQKQLKNVGSTSTPSKTGGTVSYSYANKSAIPI